MPIADSFADLIFMSMVYHHLPDPGRTARECRRILHRSRFVCIRNSTVDSIDTFPYLRFFPGYRPLIEEHLPSRDQVKEVFAEAGFDTVTHQVIDQQMSPNWTSLAEKLSHRTDSFLARISDSNFCAGLAALREYVNDTSPSESVTHDIDFFVFRNGQ